MIQAIIVKNLSKDIMLYQHHFFCCLNQREQGHALGCCASKEAEKLFNYMKQKAKQLARQENISPNTFRVNRAGCLNRCALGPVMVVYPQGVWYQPKSEVDIDDILQAHLVENTICLKHLVCE